MHLLLSCRLQHTWVTYHAMFVTSYQIPIIHLYSDTQNCSPHYYILLNTTPRCSPPPSASSNGNIGEYLNQSNANKSWLNRFTLWHLSRAPTWQLFVMFSCCFETEKRIWWITAFGIHALVLVPAATYFTPRWTMQKDDCLPCCCIFTWWASCVRLRQRLLLPNANTIKWGDKFGQRLEPHNRAAPRKCVWETASSTNDSNI